MLPKFVRAVLGSASFPTRVGQGLPDPGKEAKAPVPKPTHADRVKALGDVKSKSKRNP